MLPIVEMPKIDPAEFPTSLFSDKSFTKKEALSVSDQINIVYQDTSENSELVKKYTAEIKKKVAADSLVAGSETKIQKI